MAGNKQFSGGGKFYKGRRPYREFVPLNEKIRAKQLIVIDQHGENLGQMSKYDALKLAQDAELDLFVVTEKADVPIAKILDYGKYKFEKNKKDKTQKKKTTGSDYKEIKMRYNIDIGDYNTRLGHAKKFIEKGLRVKLNITLRGREMQHASLAKTLADRFLNDLMDVGHADGLPDKMVGRSVIVFIVPGPDKQRIEKRKREKEIEEDNVEDSSEL